jgi:hypothetical protein
MVFAYGLMVEKPALVIAVTYCVLSNLNFQASFDGSLSMYRAAEMGLVSKDFASRHPTDLVLFKHVGPDVFEYRVRRPLLGYAGIPWLVVHRTAADLIALCGASGTTGRTLKAD